MLSIGLSIRQADLQCNLLKECWKRVAWSCRELRFGHFSWCRSNIRKTRWHRDLYRWIQRTRDLLHTPFVAGSFSDQQLHRETATAAVVAVLGGISYCVYIVHLTINQWNHALLLHRQPAIYDLRGVGVTLLSVFVTWAVAATSWRYLEAPSIRRGHQYVY